MPGDNRPAGQTPGRLSAVRPAVGSPPVLGGKALVRAVAWKIGAGYNDGDDRLACGLVIDAGLDFDVRGGTVGNDGNRASLSAVYSALVGQPELGPHLSYF